MILNREMQTALNQPHQCLVGLSDHPVCDDGMCFLLTELIPVCAYVKEEL